MSVSVVGYFNRIGRDSGADTLKTLVAPVIGAIAQAVVIYLLLRNLTFLAGSENRVVTLIPLYVAFIAAAGFGFALYLKSNRPEAYACIGQLHDEEMEELFVDEIYVDEDRHKRI